MHSVCNTNIWIYSIFKTYEEYVVEVLYDQDNLDDTSLP